jgi:hypothetical protein
VEAQHVPQHLGGDGMLYGFVSYGLKWKN